MMIRTQVFIGSLIIGIMAWLYACTNNAPICNPGSMHDCTCNTGGSGQQSCHDDGQDYGPCTCSDAETPADGGVDSVTSTEGSVQQ